jgi:hypothetical protein
MVTIQEWYDAARKVHAAITHIASRAMGSSVVTEILADLECGRLGAAFTQDLGNTAIRSLVQSLSSISRADQQAVLTLGANTHEFITELTAVHYLLHGLGIRDDAVFWETLSRDLQQWGDFESFPTVRQRHLVEYAQRQRAIRERQSAALDAMAEAGEYLVRPLGRPAPQPVPEPIDDWYRDRTTPENPRPLPPAPRTDEALTESGRRRPARGVTNGRSRASATTPAVETAFGPRVTATQQQPATRGPQANLNFESGTHWQCADTTGQVRQYLFSEMEDSHLYYTLEFLIDNTALLYRQYYRDGQNLDPIARTSGTTVHEYWLKTRAAFGGLLREALRRGLTFPPNMVAFLTKNFAAGAPVRVATPWRSGAVQQEVQNLRSNVENYYTDQTAQNAGERTNRYMS